MDSWEHLIGGTMEVEQSQMLKKNVFKKIVLVAALTLISSKNRKNRLIDLNEQLQGYCNVRPVFRFNGAKIHFNLIKCYILLILFKGQYLNEWLSK